MKPSTLKEIKKKIRDFNQMLKPIIELYKSGQPHLVTMSVLLQNLGFDGSSTVGYSHEEEVLKIVQIQTILTNISRYYGETYHIELWITDEVNIIIDGLNMCEGFEE